MVLSIGSDKFLHRSSILPASLLIFTTLAASVPAEFRLLDSDTPARRSAAPWRATVEFQAQPQRARAALPERFPYTMVVTDEFTGEERLVEGQRPEGDPLAEKTLILTPTLLTEDELTVRVTVLDWLDGTVAGDADASDAVVVRPFGLGTALRGIEIIARPGLVRDADGETRTAGRLQIDIEGPPYAAGLLEVDPAALQDPLVQRVFTTNVLNPDALRAQRASEGSTVPPPPLPTPPGQYRLTYPNGNEIFHVQLEDIGIFDPAEAASLVLDHHGDALPWAWHPESGIVFYAPRNVTSSDNSDSIFVRIDPGNAAGEMATRAAFTTLPPPQNPAQATERGIQRTITTRITQIHRESLTTNSLGNRFVSTIMARAGVNLVQFPMVIRDIPTNSFAQLRATMHGWSDATGSLPDHVAGVSVNGSTPVYFNWDGFTKVTRQASWSSAITTNVAGQTAQVAYSIPVSTPTFPVLPNTDVQFVESFELTYLGKPRVDEDFASTVLVVSGAAGRISVGGFPPSMTASEVVVMDVTNPKAPIQLDSPVVFPDETGGAAVHFQAPTINRTFRVQYLGTTSAPDIVTAAEALPDTATLSSPLRAIYVRQQDLAGALAPLVALRGAGVVEITPQAAYNAFSGGQQSVDAIRDAVRLLIDRAPQKVAFPAVLLVGHGSFDLRNIASTQLYPQIPGQSVVAAPVPTNDAADGTQLAPGGMSVGENLSDYPYSRIYGDDLYPDVRVGRLPVRNAADVTRFVNKLLQYEQLFGGNIASPRPMVFAAGAGLPGESPTVFIDAHNQFVVPIWDQTSYSRIVLQYDGTSPGTTNFLNLRNAMQANSGASFILYLGHGNVSIWQGVESFIRSGNLASVFHAANIDSRNKWPIALNFTCRSGRFTEFRRDEVTQFSIVETMLHYINPDFGVPGGVVPNEKRDERGSIAAIMPVGVDFIEPLVFMETEFVGQLAGQNTPNLHRPLVVGDEWNGALVGYIDDILPIVPEYQRTLEEFSFFGDPDTLTTLVPPLAEYEVALQAIPKFASLGDAITVRVRVKAQDIGDEARALVAQVNLPAGMQYNGASPTVGSVSHNDGVILWNVGSLVPGVEVALDVQVLVLPEANLPFQVTSSVTAITPDFDPANNSAALTIGPPPEVVDSIEIY